jgi:SAM-dependent methyltransferase
MEGYFNMTTDYQKIWQDKWGDMQKYGPIHRHHRRIAKKLLAGLDFNNVLDVGCGEGSNLYFFKSLNINLKLSGVDISDQAIEQAKALIPEAELSELDIQKEKLDTKFDLVFCSDVLEHLPDDTSALKNIYDMTGKYCLAATVQGRMRNFEKKIGHVRNYAENELTGKMETAGFKIIKKIEWGWPFYSPVYRNILDWQGVEEMTGGKFGALKKLISHILYFIFLFNSGRKGDIIFVLAKK